MPDPVTLACQAPDTSRWILAALGLAMAVNIGLFLLMPLATRVGR